MRDISAISGVAEAICGNLEIARLILDHGTCKLADVHLDKI